MPALPVFFVTSQRVKLSIRAFCTCATKSSLRREPPAEPRVEYVRWQVLTLLGFGSRSVRNESCELALRKQMLV